MGLSMKRREWLGFALALGVGAGAGRGGHRRRTAW